MRNKDLIDEVSKELKFGRPELIEKDLILHNILTKLGADSFFREHFAFKGGTSLIKCFIGYERFSEDIDFTFVDQKMFEAKSSKQVTRLIKPILNYTLELVSNICEDLGMDFKHSKDDNNYIEIGGSSKIVTIKLWYTSELLHTKSFIKIQLNFVERICFPIEVCDTDSIVHSISEKTDFLFEDYVQFTNPISLRVYSVKEIFCEKMRAILTRRGIKARDFVDIYLLNRKYGILPEDLRTCLEKKMSFSLDLYKKYQDNFKEKKELIYKDQLFEWGSEKDLLLNQLDEEKFDLFIVKFLGFLKQFIESESL